MVLPEPPICNISAVILNIDPVSPERFGERITPPLIIEEDDPEIIFVEIVQPLEPPM
jgi:hypothetical protein